MNYALEVAVIIVALVVLASLWSVVGAWAWNYGPALVFAGVSKISPAGFFGLTATVSMLSLANISVVLEKV